MADFFDEDPFESIFNEFFRGKSAQPRYRKEAFIKGEGEERVIDFVETSDKIYIIFELPGYNKEDIDVRVKGRILEIKAEKKNMGNIKEYLAQKLSKGTYYKRTLPDSVDSQKCEYFFNNGILEIIFEKRSKK